MAEYALTRSREFAARHPDFNEVMNRMDDGGHTLANESVEHLKQTDRLDVGYWLKCTENRSMRDRLQNLNAKPKQQIAELDRIAAKLDRERPFDNEVDNLSETDKLLRKRRQDIKAGLRRR